MHGTHQDRLVKKLRRRGISSHQAANVFLEQEYLPEHNRRFVRTAARTEDYHRRAPRAAELNRIFRLESERAVSEDGVVRYDNRYFQLEPQRHQPASARGKVLVCQGRHGEITIEYRGRELRFQQIAAPAEPVAREVNRNQRQRRAIAASVRRKAAADHPWKQAAREAAARKALRPDRVAAAPPLACPSAWP
jgi:hypothetical protein